MAKTKAQLATSVLRKLKILQAEETANADDSTLVQTIYSDRLQALYDKELAYWPEDSIPEEVFRYLVTLIANECAPEFHQGFDPGLERYAEMKLAEHVAKSDSGEPTQAVYF